jgi:hypothetical protein
VVETAPVLVKESLAVGEFEPVIYFETALQPRIEMDRVWVDVVQKRALGTQAQGYGHTTAEGLDLHLGDDRLNDSDLPQTFRFGEDAQRPDHVDSPLNGDASGTNFVNQQLRASLLGKSDRFALSFDATDREICNVNLEDYH